MSSAANSLASASRANRSVSVVAVRPDKRDITASFTRGMSGNDAVPSRNARTVTSLAAFKTAVADGPASNASKASRRQGKRPRSGGSNVSDQGVVQSIPERDARHRSGNASAYWMGNFMSGGPNCARVDPSWNSTIEWIMDCGCTTTDILSEVTLNNHLASMTSSPLFIMVAESTVIFAPMSQFGCFNASAGVTPLMASTDHSLNGPPLAVSTIRRTSRVDSPARHW